MTELEQQPQALAVPEPHSSALVPGFLELGFRVRQVVGESIDLMIDGVRELKRLQLVAQRIIEHGTLIATLEIVTDDVYDQDDDEWWIEFSLKRADGGAIRIEDYKAAADQLATYAEMVRRGWRYMPWPTGNLPSV